MPASPCESAIVVRDLRKSYGDIHAVAGVSLEVEPGEIFALLGPNGAGKTTTVEILEGYRKRTAGDVLVLGHDPGRPEPHWRARIGVVLQSTSDNADLSVREVLQYFRTYYPRPRSVNDIIDAVGLVEKSEARVRDLSGGQRRRLDVALGILGDPELLFLDEPTTGFDPEARRQFWALIRQLKADGKTILLTTHYLDEAEQLADRVAVIAGGVILQTATPATLGGRDSGATTVTWKEDGTVHSLRTDRPTEAVRDLSTRFDGEIPELAVRRPSLEDVYLAMISEREAQTAGATT